MGINPVVCSIVLLAGQSSQLFSTVSLTLLVYSLRLSLYRLEASTFAGDPVFGSLSRLQDASCQRFVVGTDLLPHLTFGCW